MSCKAHLKTVVRSPLIVFRKVQLKPEIKDACHWMGGYRVHTVLRMFISSPHQHDRIADYADRPEEQHL